jgi:hypothetical protein
MTETEIKKKYKRWLKIFNDDEKKLMEHLEKCIKYQEERYGFGKSEKN